jgi:hypothetical protein
MNVGDRVRILKGNPNTDHFAGEIGIIEEYYGRDFHDNNRYLVRIDYDDGGTLKGPFWETCLEFIETPEPAPEPDSFVFRLKQFKMLLLQIEINCEVPGENVMTYKLSHGKSEISVGNDFLKAKEIFDFAKELMEEYYTLKEDNNV